LLKPKATSPPSFTLWKIERPEGQEDWRDILALPNGKHSLPVECLRCHILHNKQHPSQSIQGSKQLCLSLSTKAACMSHH
jgi:hypothetical protein